MTKGRRQAVYGVDNAAILAVLVFFRNSRLRLIGSEENEIERRKPHERHTCNHRPHRPLPLLFLL